MTTTQVHQILIRTDPQHIWDALVQPQFTRRYFYGVDVETTAVPGTPFRHLGADGTVLVDAEVLEAEPPRRLVVSWHPLYSPALAAESPSRVTFEIDERHDGVCLLTVVHDRLNDSPATAEHVDGLGWLTVLSGLKTLLETGSPLFAE